MCRFLRAVARVPGQTAECGCTARATRRTADPMANVPPAARTGGESEATGSSTSARQQRPKTSGHAGRGGARRWKKAKTTTDEATRTRKQIQMWTWMWIPPSPLDRLKRRRVVTSSELQVLSKASSSTKASSRLTESFFFFFSSARHAGMGVDGGEEPPRKERRGKGRRG
jgi:hypothetical protein